MKKVFCVFALLIVVTGCDLQPKIASIPDSIGDFISERYPTLLADPDSDIYQTAVSDYGMYSSSTEYGNGDMGVDDYVLYSPADDYAMPAQDTYVASTDAGMPDESQDDDYGYAPDTDVDDLKIPDYVNEKPVTAESVDDVKPEVDVVAEVKTPEQKTPDEPVREITVAKGDTLYSLAHKYSVSADDLANVNKISAPYKLLVGQTLKMPKQAAEPSIKPQEPKSITKPEQKKPEKKVELKPKQEAVVARSGVFREITVAKGDTLYSLSRQYSVPVNDLAVMNKISAPFALSVGQKLKVPGTKKVDVKEIPDNKKSDVKPSVKGKPDTKNAKKTEVKSGNVKSDNKKSVQKSADKKSEVKKSQADKKTVKKQETKTEQKKENVQKSSKTNKMVARSSSKFSWPVRGKILSGYGSKTNGLFNDGINIKASRGATVSAAENGYVAYAGNEVKGMGNLVIIQHSGGWMTVYAHMDSMNVRRGHSVAVGQKIGVVGATGKVDQPQLHFEIRKGTKAYNPINYLKK